MRKDNKTKMSQKQQNKILTLNNNKRLNKQELNKPFSRI